MRNRKKTKATNRFTVVRFDPFHEPRVPNTARRTPARSILPIDFPMVFDAESGDVVEPILIHLHHKFYGKNSIKEGQWIKKESADSAAEDLRMWWEYLHATGRPWERVSDAALATYLTILAEELSATTGNHLAEQTIRGRRSSIGEFYKFATVKWNLHTSPSIENAAILSRSHPLARRDFDIIAVAESDPHPIEQDLIDDIAEKLGPLPSRWKTPKDGSSRSRLAFELGINVGLRVDEIVNLKAAMFKDVPLRRDAWDVPFVLKLKKTKGLVKRSIEVPQWLLEEMQIYLGPGGEREASLAQGRRTWLVEGAEVPHNLLLNQVRGDDAGKRSRREQIESDFSNALTALKIMKAVTIAEGTSEERVESRPRHVFHDCRHTYALWQYRAVLGLDSDDRDKVQIVGGVVDFAVRHVQRLLGHKDPEVTKRIYLDVFEQVSEQVTALLQGHLRSIRNSRHQGEPA